MLIKKETIDGLDNDVIINEIILNKRITTKSQTNMYEILFKSKSISKIFDVVINALKNKTKENYDVYIKNMWGYIQTTFDNTPIIVDKKIIDGISPMSKYSFIYCAKSDNTIIDLKSINDEILHIELNVGNVIIFKTDSFIKDTSTSLDRILVVGSITNEIESNFAKTISLI